MRPGAAVLLTLLALLQGPLGVSGVHDEAVLEDLLKEEPKPKVPPSTSMTLTRTSTTTTSTTITTTTTTTVTSTTSTTTSTSTTTGFHVFGGQGTKKAFEGWLRIWRDQYKDSAPCGIVPCLVPVVDEDSLPSAMKGITPLVLLSHGGVASGVVTEGMGYGLMIEGFLAVQGKEGSKQALRNGLGLFKSWLGMVAGPEGVQQPFAGGAMMMGENGVSASATEVGQWPYGTSAILSRSRTLGPSGMAAWKFPLNTCKAGCNGSATDGDQDAVLGMIYLADALGYPADFVDAVVRAVISFASADLGFPDLYRTLPGGERIYVPKMGSNWGGLTPEGGKFATQKQPWCYGPGYFAPAHYRTFRDFLKKVWNSDFAEYLPPHLDGTPTSLEEITGAFDGAVTAGYNLLHYSSCISGSVANWVGVKSECTSPDQLGCAGVPWEHTPFVGPEKGTCEESGTAFGAYGPDASRTAWRIAMDYVLFREESAKVTIFDRAGNRDPSIVFNAQVFLNRIAFQYKKESLCDGGKPGECLNPQDHPPNSPWKLSTAFDPKKNASDVQCPNVPNKGESWWAGFMSYPTFAAFVAPFEQLPASESVAWMDTFASICDFSGSTPKGAICRTSYFESSQAVIATLVMADNLSPLWSQAPERIMLKSYSDDEGGWHLRSSNGQDSWRTWQSVSLLLVASASGLTLVTAATRLFQPASRASVFGTLGTPDIRRLLIRPEASLPAQRTEQQELLTQGSASELVPDA